MVDVGEQTRVGRAPSRPVEQHLWALGAPRVPCAVGSGDETPRLLSLIARELGGAFERRGGSRVTASATCPLGGALELVGNLVVRGGDRRSAMPGTPVGVVLVR